MYTTDVKVRAEFIAGLRELADYLAVNPAVPVPSHGAEISVHTCGTDDAKRAQVDQAAVLLGTPVTDDTATGGHYTTEREFGSTDRFGAKVTFRVVAVMDARMAAWTAHMSYADNVIPA